MKKFYYLLIVIIIIVVGVIIFQSSKGSDKNENTSNSENNTSTSEVSQPVTTETAIDSATKQNNTTEQESIAILFYGEGCSHCAEVQQWLDDNKVREKIKFEEKEIRYNKDNSKLLNEKAQVCKINDDEVGVPFLFDTVNNKCFVGKVEVENFFKGKI